MHWIDWIIVCIPLMVVLGIGLKSQRYVKSVSDFLTARRVAGRYVVCVASGEAGMICLFRLAWVDGYFRPLRSSWRSSSHWPFLWRVWEVRLPSW